jgi:hypothetical protein
MSTNKDKLTVIAAGVTKEWAEVPADKYLTAFNKISHLESATEELPVDMTGMPGPWSITYGGDENMDNILYSPLVVAALNCAVDKGFYITLTLESAHGERVAFDCTVPTKVTMPTQAWGDNDGAHIMVHAWYPETQSMGVDPVKVYLHQIINIHFP